MSSDKPTAEHPLFCVCDKCAGETAAEHRAADERCGRDWDKGGCQCAACRRTREILAGIDASFARITALENQLAEHRRRRDDKRGT